MQSRHWLVKGVLKSIGLYFLYNICVITKKQMVLQEARRIQQQQIRYGGEFQLSEEKKKILAQAEEYLDNHAGYRYLNRMRTEQFFEMQFEKKIKEKEEALKEVDPKDKEQMDKLKSHLEQLNKAYRSVLPKMPSSWDDLRDKDEEEED